MSMGSIFMIYVAGKESTLDLLVKWFLIGLLFEFTSRKSLIQKIVALSDKFSEKNNRK